MEKEDFIDLINKLYEAFEIEKLNSFKVIGKDKKQDIINMK